MPKAQQKGNRFDIALQFARRSRQLSQEQFDVVSSRTYVSSLERGIKSPTLSKIDDLATVMGLHPATLLLLAYAKPGDRGSTSDLLEIVAAELRALETL